MKFSMTESETFATALAVAREFNEFVSFSVADGRLHASILDATHVSVTTIDMGIEVDDDATGSFSIKTDELSKTIALGGGGSLTMDVSNDTARISMNEGKIQVDLRLFDVDVDLMSVDGYDAACTYTVSSNDFFKLVKDMGTFGDTIAIGQGDGMRLVTKGDMGTVSVDIDASRDGSVVGTSSYATKYIISLSKASKLSSSIGVSLGDCIPMRITLSNDRITVSFYLAPKIQDDDENEDE